MRLVSEESVQTLAAAHAELNEWKGKYHLLSQEAERCSQELKLFGEANKRLDARCRELSANLEKTNLELKMFKDANKTLAPILASRKFESGLPNIARLSAIENGNSSIENEDVSFQSETLFPALVRELSSAKEKMNVEMNELRSLLETSQNEVMALQERLEELKLNRGYDLESEGVGQSTTTEPQRTVFDEIEEYIVSRSIQNLSQSFSSDPGVFEAVLRNKTTGASRNYPSPDRRSSRLVEHLDSNAVSLFNPVSDESDQNPPLTSQISNKLLSTFSDGIAPTKNVEVVEPAKQVTSSTHIYIRTLHSMAVALHERLNATDTVSLNRQLKREFDLPELTRLSQSVIENISRDVDNLDSRFPPASDESNTKNTDSRSHKRFENAHDRTEPISQERLFTADLNSVVLPMVSLIQALLKDLAQLRGTLNDLSLAFYERVVQNSKEDKAKRIAQQNLSRTPTKKASFWSSSPASRGEGTSESEDRISGFDWFRGLTISSSPSAGISIWRSLSSLNENVGTSTPPSRSTNLVNVGSSSSFARSRTVSANAAEDAPTNGAWGSVTDLFGRRTQPTSDIELRSAYDEI